jgi:hypothetical protein
LKTKEGRENSFGFDKSNFVGNESESRRKAVEPLSPTASTIISTPQKALVIPPTKTKLQSTIARNFSILFRSTFLFHSFISFGKFCRRIFDLSTVLKAISCALSPKNVLENILLHPFSAMRDKNSRNLFRTETFLLLFWHIL